MMIIGVKEPWSVDPHTAAAATVDTAKVAVAVPVPQHYSPIDAVAPIDSSSQLDLPPYDLDLM